MSVYDDWDAAVDKMERELLRLHPETITPREWIQLQAIIKEWIAVDRDIISRLRELNQEWQQRSGMSWLSSILSRHPPK